MNAILIILISMLIAGVIGLFTNIIAIGMLFRPYGARYIGKKKLPLTPGLIPKRQADIANHLGKTVMNHLLTAEGIEEKLTNPEFQKQMKAWIKKGVTQWVHTEERSLADIVKSYDSTIDIDQKLRYQLERRLDHKFDEWLLEIEQQPLAHLVPEELMKRTTDKLPEVNEWVFQRIETYLHSHEGREQMQNIVRRFLERQGSLVQMLGSFVKTDRIIEKVYPEIVKAITSDDMRVWVNQKVQSEFEDMLNEPLNRYVSKEQAHELKLELTAYVFDKFSIEKYTNRPIHEWGAYVNEEIIDRIVDAAVSRSSRMIQLKLPEFLKLLNLQEVVADQINRFSVQQLEGIVLSIANRELRLIKYLGGVLGAIIGFIQGLILLMFI
ncbi:DUF445 domain-containing protein [Geomicrobium sp. JSM 1781026]|uniref:DUF445 domain-containing protein n=1 Tax=Geomicrobium sp. JSM 1781026 TaxID=3344580 RepID=UPI0035C26883